MKYSLPSAALAVIALSLGSCAGPSALTAGGPGSDGLTMAALSKQIGQHGARNFTLTRMKPGQLGSDQLSHPIVLVVTAESKMEGGKQVINVSASSHLDGPEGALEAVGKIGFRMTQPVNYQSKPNPTPTAEVHGSQSVAAAGGKYKTVVVEAFISDEKLPDTKATVTVPGDK